MKPSSPPSAERAAHEPSGSSRSAKRPLVRKVLLAVGVALATAALLSLRAGHPAETIALETDPETPAQADARAISALLLGTFSMTVDPAELYVAETADAPLGPGRGLVVAFAAVPPGHSGPSSPSGDNATDVFRWTLRLSENRASLAASRLVNLTRTTSGEERVVALDAARLAYVFGKVGRVEGVRVLDFSIDDSVKDASLLATAIGRLSAWQSFDVWRNPGRWDLLLVKPLDQLTDQPTDQPSKSPRTEIGGRFEGSTFVAALDGQEWFRVEADPEGALSLKPSELGALRRGGAPPLEMMSLLADVLRSSAVMGTARVAALEAMVLEARDALLRLRHQLFPTQEDRLPVAQSVEIPAARWASWPPTALPIPEGERVPGEGLWVDPWGGTNAAILRTFVRVDPARPYERVYLFALDARRLALRFVAGTVDPRSTTGTQGSGRIAEVDRPSVVAAFNGGFKTEHGAYGTVERSLVVIPPQAGAATVALDALGRARFGVWDVPFGASPGLPPGVFSLRQNLAPLIDAGIVNPSRTRQWGQLVSRLDEAHTPRSALGVTEAGIVVFGWASATSAEQLGEALRRAGVRFALHLDMNPIHTGLELYVPQKGELVAMPGTDEMDFRARRWLETDGRDFFYLTTVAQATEPSSEPQDLGDFQVEQARRAVHLHRLEGVRPVFVPGTAELSTSDTSRIPRKLKLAAAPVMAIDVGLRLRGEGAGLVSGEHAWVEPRPGLSTFWVDADGEPHIGLWTAEQPLAAHMIQGVSLIEAGEIVTTPPPPGGPDRIGVESGADSGADNGARGLHVALGLEANGALLIATYAAETPSRAVARVLFDAGAVDAVQVSRRLNDDTGDLRFFELSGDRLLQRRSLGGLREPASLRPTAGTTMLLLPRPPTRRAWVVTTFRP